MTDANTPNNWQQVPGDGNPQSDGPKKEEDWTDKTWQDVKAGFSQVEQALREAYRKSKDDPRFKKLGQDVKASLERIGQDISDLFDGDKKP